MRYYPAFICEKGDIIETSQWFCDSKYCEKCNAPVISKCKVCGTPIRGHAENASGAYTLPLYCRECGNPYPWTAATLQATADILKEDDFINEEERSRLIEVLPDVISETPKTQLALVRIKKALRKLGTFAADGLRQFILDFGCELAKDLFFR